MLAGPITTFTSTIFPKQSRSKKTKKSIHMTIPKRHASTLSTFAFTNIRLKRFKKSPSHSNTTRAVSQHTQPLVRIYPLPLPPTLQPQNSHRTQTCHLPPYRNPTPEKYNSTTPKHTNLTTTTTPTTIINNTTHFRKTFRHATQHLSLAQVLHAFNLLNHTSCYPFHPSTSFPARCRNFSN